MCHNYSRLVTNVPHRGKFYGVFPYFFSQPGRFLSDYQRIKNKQNALGLKFNSLSANLTKWLNVFIPNTEQAGMETKEKSILMLLRRRAGIT